MPSSHKIIKQGQSFTHEQRSFIATQLNVVEEPAEEKQKDAAVDASIIEETEAEKEARACLAAAQDKKTALLEAAEKEAEEIKETALKQGFAAGNEQGYREGYATGYTSGIEKAAKESEQMKAAVQTMMSEAQEFVETYYEEQKLELLKLAAHMAETIVHATIDASSEQVMGMVKPVIHRLKRESQLITLMVRPEQSQLVKDSVKELEKEHPDLRFAVLTDSTLDKNGCVIESSHAIIDLQVRKQLDAMLEDMQNME